MKVTKELKVGIFSIISLSILYCGGLFMKGSEIFSTNDNYYAYVENVEGLSEGSKIFINGSRIGLIKKMEFLPEENFRTKVTFSIDKKIKLNKNSYLNSVGSITGPKSLRLKVGEGEAIESGAEILFCAGTDLVSDVMQKGSPIVSDIQLVLKSINLFVEKLNENNANIKKTISHLEQTTKNLNETIVMLSPQISKILQNVNDDENGLNPILTKLNSIAQKIDDIKIEEIGDNVNGCVKKIKDDPIWENTNNTILEVQKAVKDLDRLLIDIRVHPHNYVNFSLWGNKKKSNIKE